MKITITEPRISTADPATGQHYVLHEGDTITVPDAFGQSLCDYGWAQDAEGDYPTGERTPGPQALTVPPTTIVATEG